MITENIASVDIGGSRVYNTRRPFIDDMQRRDVKSDLHVQPSLRSGRRPGSRLPGIQINIFISAVKGTSEETGNEANAAFLMGRKGEF